MHVFCTLFDSNYLSRGLAMHRSLLLHCPNFHLYVFAFDANSEKILNELKLKNVTVIGLTEFEDEALLRVKPSRSVAEYCWTCTSSTILYVLEHFKEQECTYIDADIYFYADPEPIFREFGKKSILLTEHRFSPEYQKDEINGRFCVQFITFKNDENGREALTWWRKRCLEWCYSRFENGKFGDQGYLNDWENRFSGVHVLRHIGGGVAAWNVQQYRLFAEGEKIFGTDLERGRDFELIFYHFHYVRFFSNSRIELGRRVLAESVLTLLYKPYVRHLEEVKSMLADKYPGFDPHGAKPEIVSWKTLPLYLLRKLNGVYHIYELADFLK